MHGDKIFFLLDAFWHQENKAHNLGFYIILKCFTVCYSGCARVQNMDRLLVMPQWGWRKEHKGRQNTMPLEVAFKDTEVLEIKMS